MKTVVILFWVLIFRTTFIASVPLSEEPNEQSPNWQSNQNAPSQQYQSATLIPIQDGNVVNAALTENNVQNNNNNGYTLQPTLIENKNGAQNTYSMGESHVQVDNQPYRQQNWQVQNQFKTTGFPDSTVSSGVNNPSSLIINSQLIRNINSQMPPEENVKYDENVQNIAWVKMPVSQVFRTTANSVQNISPTFNVPNNIPELEPGTGPVNNGPHFKLTNNGPLTSSYQNIVQANRVFPNNLPQTSINTNGPILNSGINVPSTSSTGYANNIPNIAYTNNNSENNNGNNKITSHPNIENVLPDSDKKFFVYFPNGTLEFVNADTIELIKKMYPNLKRIDTNGVLPPEYRNSNLPIRKNDVTEPPAPLEIPPEYVQINSAATSASALPVFTEDGSSSKLSATQSSLSISSTTKPQSNQLLSQSSVNNSNLTAKQENVLTSFPIEQNTDISNASSKEFETKEPVNSDDSFSTSNSTIHDAASNIKDANLGYEDYGGDFDDEFDDDDNDDENENISDDNRYSDIGSSYTATVSNESDASAAEKISSSASTSGENLKTVSPTSTAAEERSSVDPRPSMAELEEASVSSTSSGDGNSGDKSLTATEVITSKSETIESLSTNSPSATLTEDGNFAAASSLSTLEFPVSSSVDISLTSSAEGVENSGTVLSTSTDTGYAPMSSNLGNGSSGNASPSQLANDYKNLKNEASYSMATGNGTTSTSDDTGGSDTTTLISTTHENGISGAVSTSFSAASDENSGSKLSVSTVNDQTSATSSNSSTSEVTRSLGVSPFTIVGVAVDESQRNTSSSTTAVGDGSLKDASLTPISKKDNSAGAELSSSTSAVDESSTTTFSSSTLTVDGNTGSALYTKTSTVDGSSGDAKSLSTLAVEGNSGAALLSTSVNNGNSETTLYSKISEVDTEPSSSSKPVADGRPEIALPFPLSSNSNSSSRASSASISPQSDTNKNLDIDLKNLNGEPTLWVRMTEKEFYDKIADKTTPDRLYYIQVVGQYYVEKNRHTTVYCNGTVVEDLTETTYNSKDDSHPKVVKKSTVTYFNGDQI